MREEAALDSSELPEQLCDLNFKFELEYGRSVYHTVKYRLRHSVKYRIFQVFRDSAPS